MAKKHVIDGVEYVEVEREAKVGERIVVVSPFMNDGYVVGDIFTVRKPYEYNHKAKGVYVNGLGTGIRHHEYRVLEPIESEEVCCVTEAQASPQVVELLANLARRVTSLESRFGSIEAQLRDTQGNLEKFAQELGDIKHLTYENDRFLTEIDTRLGNAKSTKEVDVNFLDSVAEKVAERLVRL